MYQTLFLMLSLSASTALAQSCYHDAGQSLDESYIPCGTGDAAACCRLGDFCLDEGACYSPSTGVTYLSGCTDSTYSSSVCPGKSCSRGGFQFQGLASCGGENWFCCEGNGQQGDYPSTDPRDDCPCDAGFSIGITGHAKLQATTSLPVVAPEQSSTTSTTPSSTEEPPTSTTETPTTTPSSTSSEESSNTTSDMPSTTDESSSTTSSSSDTPSILTVTATQTPTEGVVIPPDVQPVITASSSSTSSPTAVPTESGLSKGAKIGVGVGVPIAAALIGGLAIACFCLRRRQRNSAPYQGADQSVPVWQGDVSGQPVAQNPTATTLGTTAYSGQTHGHYAPVATNEKGAAEAQKVNRGSQGRYTPSLAPTASPPPQYQSSPRAPQGHHSGIWVPEQRRV